MSSETVSWEVQSIVQGAIKIKFPERQHDRDKVLSELMTSVLNTNAHVVAALDTSRAKREQESEKLAADPLLWERIENIVDLADRALKTSHDDSQFLQRWRQEPASALEGKKEGFTGPISDDLTACAVEYKQAAWAKSPTLELWLVRKMIFSETHAFSVASGIPLHAKSYSLWWNVVKSILKLVVGLAVAIGIGEAHGLAIGIFTFVAWLCFMQYLARDAIDRIQRLSQTFAAMRTAYVVSMRDFACPVEIERHLALAEDSSAVWPDGLRTLIECAIARNRAVWR